MRRHAKASSVGMTRRRSAGPGRLALIALALLGLVAFLGTSAPAASADECPNEALRVGFSAQLPECRAYERVSPADKGGVDLTTNGVLGIGIDNIIGADNPGAVSFPSWAAFGDAISAPPLSTYIARRTASGWLTHSANPPIKAGLLSAGAVGWGLTSDLTKGLVGGPSEAEGFLPTPVNLIDTASRKMTLVADSGDEFTPLVVSGYSNDMSHVVVRSGIPLTPDSPPGNSYYLYDWTKEGGLVNVGRLPDNSLAPGSVQSVQPECSFCGLKYHPVSDDGSRIFFITGEQLYVRENGTTTKHVSAPAPGAPAEPAQHARFLFASVDGSNAFFCSSQRLTADSTAIPKVSESEPYSEDLYRYQVPTEELTDITVNSDPQGARVCHSFEALYEYPLGGADDASRIYFVAEGKLTNDAPTSSGKKIYVWHDDGTAKGELTYVASVPPGTQYVPGESQQRDATRVSPNGRWAAFASTEGESTKIMRYDAVTKELVCASCNPDGETHSRFHGNGESGPTHVERNPANLLDDGRLFFESRDALVPQDIDNYWDVYEYVDGQQHLISSGTDAPDNFEGNVFFGDASLDGTDVYFETRAQLVASDTDTLIDVYDARVDGGFKSDLTPPPPNCNGEACKPPPTTAPASAGAGSAVFAGAGNQGRKVGSVRKRKRCGKRKGAKKCHRSRHANANRGGSK